jgi:proline iminopeptidase
MPATTRPTDLGGATPVLAYAQRHPERVSGLIMPSAMLVGPSTVDWLYRDLGRVFPEAWDRFRLAAPGDGDLILAYSRLMEDPDPAVRSAAASEWLRWEETAISLEPNSGSGLYSTVVGEAQIAFDRICAHIFGHRDGSPRAG